MEKSSITYEKGISPREANIAFTSIDASGGPDSLTEYVLSSAGYDLKDLPGEKELKEGHYLKVSEGRIPIIFIVTNSNKGHVADSLRVNMDNAQSQYSTYLKGQRIWIPLLGTGNTHLSIHESIRVVTGIIKENLDRTYIGSEILLSLPVDIDDSDIGFLKKLIDEPTGSSATGSEAEFQSQKFVNQEQKMNERMEKDPGSEDQIEVLRQKIRTNKDHDFWWINASADIWSIDKLTIGATEKYTTHNRDGVQRQVFNHFFEAKTGDLAIGYQSVDETRIKALLEITRPAEDRNGDTFEFKLIYFFKKQTSYRELSALEIFKQTEVAQRNNRGSLFKLTYEQFTGILNTTELFPVEEESEVDKTSDKIPFHLDNVETTDKLDREPIAKSLARLLNNDVFKNDGKIDHSFMIHLQGAWGEGKSTFLRLLEKHLNDKAKESSGGVDKKEQWIIVNFNAWQHQHIDPPWWIFMDSVYRKIREDEKYNPVIWIKERWWRLFRLQKAYWLSVLLLLIIFLAVNIPAGFDWLNLKILLKDPESAKNILSTITSYFSIFGSIWLVVKAISRSLIRASSDAANEFKNHFRDPMRELKRHYGEIIHYSSKKVAVFIDDLDRCNESFVVGLLEGIQTLFKEERVLYVIAGDRKWISICFENHYEKYKGVANEPIQRLGYLFLEKAFQLYIRLPKVPEATKKEYWEYILNPDSQNAKPPPEESEEKKKMMKEIKTRVSQNYSQEELVKPDNIEKIRKEYKLEQDEVTDIALEVMDESQEDIKHLLQSYYPLLDANPRSIKRLANQYTVYRNIMIAEGKRFERNKLFRWLVLQNKYPVFADWLEGNLHEFEHGVSLPEEFEMLYDDEKWNQLMKGEGLEEDKLSAEEISTFTGIVIDEEY